MGIARRCRTGKVAGLGTAGSCSGRRLSVGTLAGGSSLGLGSIRRSCSEGSEDNRKGADRKLVDRRWADRSLIEDTFAFFLLSILWVDFEGVLWI